MENSYYFDVYGVRKNQYVSIHVRGKYGASAYYYVGKRQVASEKCNNEFEARKWAEEKLGSIEKVGEVMKS